MSGRRIVLTGAASGIGRAIFELLDAKGDQIVALDIKPAASASQTFIECDLSDPGAIDAAVGRIDGNIDVLLNVAGAPGTLDPLRVMQVNILGLRHLTERLLARIDQGGSIVNVASISGTDWQAHSEQVNGLLDTHGFAEGSAWFESNPSDGSGAYTLSKQCVVAYTKRIAERGLAGHFNCNSVSPGPVETPLLKDFHKQEYPGQIDWVIAQTGRAATTQDIAKVMSFLITPEARWINGQDIQVDGGFIAGLEAGWIDGSQSPRRRAARRGQ